MDSAQKHRPRDSGPVQRDFACVAGAMNVDVAAPAVLRLEFSNMQLNPVRAADASPKVRSA